jgi:acetylglutamate kinase
MTDFAHLIDKADILHEALPYIRRFHGKKLVIKYGGHAMEDEALKESFARDVVLLHYVGLQPVIVHGGGPQVSKVLERMGIPTTFVDGLRITDEETMDVVEMVLGGSVNQEIVALVCQHGGRAVGLSGKDDRFILAEKIEIERAGGRKKEIIDPGRVGEPKEINPEVVQKLLDAGFIPVIAPVGVDAEGHALNINADTVAARIAESLGAEKLMLLTDVEGVRDAEGKMLSSLDEKQAKKLLDDGVISGGMIPKVRWALDAINCGVSKVHIIDGRLRHAVLLEIFTDLGIGTEIQKEELKKREERTHGRKR